jgi:GTP-binding protein
VTSHHLESARFATSVADLAELNAAPLAMVPEIAFVGRSNAGKSSTINALARRRRLAFAAKTPGRTQLLNFFALIARDGTGHESTRGYLVDLPGYGFAKVDAATRARWDRLVGGYLHTRRMLRGVVLVMDARHPLKPADEELLNWLATRADAQTLRVHVLLNKADQLRGAQRGAALARVEQRAADLPMPVSVQLFSASTREGIEELHAAIDEMLGR